MTTVLWRRELSVGDDEIDAQHRYAFELVEDIQRCTAASESADVVDNLLDRFAGHMCEHFAFEERLMRAVQYPALDRHTVQHRSLIVGVTQIVQNFRTGQIALDVSLYHYLTRWLESHVLTEDHAMTKWVSALGGDWTGASSGKWLKVATLEPFEPLRVRKAR